MEKMEEKIIVPSLTISQPFIANENNQEDDQQQNHVDICDYYRLTANYEIEQEKITPDSWIKRSNQLIRLTDPHPFNAEPLPETLLAGGLNTPNEIHFVRNHGNVPKLEWDTHQLTVCGLVEKEYTFSMTKLFSRFKETSVPVTIACDGNRRKEINTIKKTKSYSNGPGSVGTAIWSGVRLLDVLNFVVIKQGAKYIHFEGADKLPRAVYATSIPIEWALNPSYPIIIACKMNGEVLPPDHGYPCRVIIPGMVGGRHVKWLKKITLSEKESENYYHLYDNKFIPPEVGMSVPETDFIWKNTPESILYELNVNSFICKPTHLESVTISNSNVLSRYTIQGFAYSGGGRKITRVELTFKKGKEWEKCDIEYYSMDKVLNKDKIPVMNKTFNLLEYPYTWVRFEFQLPLWRLLQAEEFSVRAFDTSYNTQPEKPYWNIKGMMNNSWYTIKYELKGKKDEYHVTFLHPTISGHAMAREGWMVPKNMLINEHQPHKVLFTDHKKAHASFSLDEVKKHNKENDCWIILNGCEVYDVTAYLRYHPGGKDSILVYGGKDATKVFRDIHSHEAHDIKQWYYIGNLLPSHEDDHPEAKKKISLLNPKKWLKCKLINKKSITHNSRIFQFKIIDHGVNDESILSVGLPLGQHVLIGADINNKFFIRPYTPIIPALPEEDLNGVFSLLVKIYFKGEDHQFPLGGVMSLYLDSLHEGDSVRVKGPAGPIEYHHKGIFTSHGISMYVKKINAIAGGTGITPIYQMLKAILETENREISGIKQEDKTKISLIFSNKTTNDILLRKELDELAKRFPHQFRIWYTVSGVPPNTEWNYSKGRIDDEMIKEHLFSPNYDVVCVLCGPPSMIEYACRPGLEKLGFGGDNIFEF